MSEVILNAVPDYSQFGRAAKLRLNPNHIEDLGWTIPTEHQNITYGTRSRGKFSKHKLPKADELRKHKQVCQPRAQDTKNILVLESH